MKGEAIPGLLIILSALAALVFCNVGFDAAYANFWGNRIELSVGSLSVHKQLLPLVNEGLMALFFLVVTLEIKYECLFGFLNSRKCIAFPLVGALGGMLVPAMIYLFFNFGGSYTVGWAIPTATDIAFSLACLFLLGDHFPPSLRVFLLSLAIFDDLGAIIIIALYYSSNLSTIMLVGATVVCGLMTVCRYFQLYSIKVYVVLSLVLWVLMVKSGVHATLTGCLLAIFLPMKHDNGQSAMGFRDRLLPYVQYIILPIFAFANTGMIINNQVDLLHPVAKGIMAGLLIGKPLGIVGLTQLTNVLGLTEYPEGLSVKHIVGVSFLCGIGFTMSLFIGMLAFDESMDAIMDIVRLSVLTASLISGIIGMLCLFILRTDRGKS